MKYRLPSALLVGLFIATLLSLLFVAQSSNLLSATSTDVGSWSLTSGGFLDPHQGFGASLLPNGKVLVAGGADLTSSELFDPATGRWTRSGNLNIARARLNLVTLQNGKVIAPGGTVAPDYGSGDTNIVEMYDPNASNSQNWSYTGFLNTARRGAGFVLLNDGKVLAVGGAHGVPDGNRFLASSELYDPNLNNGQWRYTAGHLSVPREGLFAIKLQSGKVLIGGGEGPWYTPGNTAELYDPINESWSSAGTMPWGMFGGAAVTLLSSGKVLLTGGYGNGITSSAAIFDPNANSTNAWSLAKPMNSPRTGHAAILLTDGRVLVSGGSNGQNNLQTSEIYDPNADTWTSISLTLQSARSGMNLVQLLNGDTLAIAGYNDIGALTSSEIFHPTISTPTPTPTATATPTPISSCKTQSVKGYSPSQVNHAYGFDQLKDRGITGKNQKIAVIVTYGSQTIEEDIKTFSAQLCLSKPSLSVKHLNKPFYDKNFVGDWPLEASMDVEWIHAFAQDAEIVLIVRNSTSDDSLLAALDYAIQQKVSVVSMSFTIAPAWIRIGEKKNEIEERFRTSEIVFVASVGEGGGGNDNAKPLFPAVSPNVLAVGATTINLDKTGNVIGDEKAWENSVGGYVSDDKLIQPTYQFKYGIPSKHNRRSIPDVSFMGERVSVYYNKGWQTPRGATSFAAPAWASLIALANQERSTKLSNIQDVLYELAKDPALYKQYFRDITKGTSQYCYHTFPYWFAQTCKAEANYDFATGLGSPKANTLVSYLTSYTKSGGS